MRFTVTWHPAAEQELANIWLRSQQREEVTAAVHQIDKLLASDPSR